MRSSRRQPSHPCERARKHGFYAEEPDDITIDQAIAGLVHRLHTIDELLAQETQDAEPRVRLLELYAQALSCLARMLRDRRALYGEAADRISGPAEIVQRTDPLDEIGHAD